MAYQRSIVTGGTGKAGHWIVKHLVDVPLRERPCCKRLTADLTDLGQAIDAVSPHATGDRTPSAGVIRMAAIPRPHLHPSSEVWRANTRSTYSVLEACGLLGILEVVLGSSESCDGTRFAKPFLEPRCLPAGAAHPQLPEATDGLTKVVGDAAAAMFHRRDGTQILWYRVGDGLCPDAHERVKARSDHPEDLLRARPVPGWKQELYLS